jgi:uncharacterized phiE125 gp8 family phage protein
MRLVLVTAPDGEPLTAAEAKARLNIGDEVTDAVMEAYITASRQQIDGADGWLGRALMTQTWQYNLDEFPSCDGGKVYIPLPPLREISEVSYLDSAGDPVVMVVNDDYQVVMGPRPYIVPAYGTTWPSVTCRADAITIEFIAGYGDSDEVPEPIRTAIALGAGHLRSMSARNLSITEEVEEGVGSTRYVVSANAGEVISATQKALLSTYRVIVL